MRHTMLITLAAAAALAVAACGGDDAAVDTSPTTNPAATRPPTTSSAASPTSVPATELPRTLAPAEPTLAPTQPPAPPPANTPAPIPTPTTAPPPPPPPPAATTLNLTAASVRFSPTSLSALAGNVTIALNNTDAGISHNVHVFAGTGASGTSMGATAIAAGPVQQTLDLGALSSGAYFYRCDVHPSQMTGTLTVS